jgi:uncharacterized protein Smg (DUF494 family)
MKERIVEILIYLMSEMQENKTLQDIDLGDLKNKGYTQSEISAAYSWIFENMQNSPPQPLPSGRPAGSSRRVLHDAEKLVFSTESQGYLIQLRELGLLDEVDLETAMATRSSPLERSGRLLRPSSLARGRVPWGWIP